MPYKREPKPTIDDLAEGHAASPAEDGDTEGHYMRPGRAPRHAAGDGVVVPAGEGDERA